MALPTKRFRTVLDNVKTTLSGLASFQTITETSTAAAAAAHIHFFAALDDGTQPWPRIVLDIDDYRGRYNGGRFNGPVNVLVMIQYGIPVAYQTNEATEAGWFWDQIEDWFDELEAATNGGGQLILNAIDMTMSPGLIEPDDINGKRVWFTQFSLQFQT